MCKRQTDVRGHITFVEKRKFLSHFPHMTLPINSVSSSTSLGHSCSCIMRVSIHRVMYGDRRTSYTFVPQTELNSGEWLVVDVDDGDGGCR